MDGKCKVVGCHEQGTVKCSDKRRRAPEWFRACAKHAGAYRAGRLEWRDNELHDPKATPPPKKPKPPTRNRARKVTDDEILAQIPDKGATTKQIADGVDSTVGQSAVYQRLRRLERKRKVKHTAKGRLSSWRRLVPRPTPPPRAQGALVDAAEPMPDRKGLRVVPSSNDCPPAAVAPTVAELEAKPSPPPPDQEPDAALLAAIETRRVGLVARECSLQSELAAIRGSIRALEFAEAVAKQSSPAEARQFLLTL